MVAKRYASRRLLLSAAVGAVALTSLTARGQITVINDDFNDNNLTTNTTGTGSGWTPVSNYGPVGTETNSAFRTDTSTGGNYQLQGISSRDGFDFWNAGGATIQFTTRNAAVTVDKSNATTQFRGGPYSDYRQELGLVSFRRSNTDAVPDELYANTSGGLYITLFYDGNGSGNPNNLTVTGNLRAVSKQKTGAGDAESTTGLQTIATFTLGGYDGQSDLLSTLHVNNTSFSLGFDKPVSWQVDDFVGSSITVDGQGRLVGNYSDFNLAAQFTSDLSGEFNNPLGPDAFIYAHGANVENGRGSAELSKVVVNAAQVAETPPPGNTIFNVSAGNWSTAANWTAGEPTTVQWAIVDNNGTVTIDQSAEVARGIHVGSDNGLTAPVNAAGRGGTLVVQSGADLHTGDSILIGQATGSSGTFNMTGGNITVDNGGDGDFIIGDFGTATGTMSGGSITAADEFIVGAGTTGNGNFTMTGGTITTLGRNFVVGLDGTGVANISGTSVLHPNEVFVGINGHGELNFGGTAAINAAWFWTGRGAGSTSTVTQSGGSINLGIGFINGQNSVSTHNMSGGSISALIYVAGDGDLGNGTLNLSGTGSINCANDFWVGAWGTAHGTVNQQGGSVSSNWIFVGRQGQGTYNMSGGTLSQSGDGNMFVGHDGWGPLLGDGFFNQTGGAVSVQNNLRMGDFDDSNGVYKISGGTLTVGQSLNVGAALASNAPADDVRAPDAGQALNASGTFIVRGSSASINVGNLRANPADRVRTGPANTSNFGFEILSAAGTSTINVAQKADMDGAVVDVDFDGYTPTAGQTFNLITAGSFGAVGTGSTNSNGSSGTGIVQHAEDVGQVALAVLPNGTTSQSLKAGAGNRITVPNIRGTNATVIAGTVRVQPNGTTAGMTHVDTLSIAPNAALDLTDNDLIVEHGNFQQITALRWQGYRDAPDSTATGIISSAGQTITGAPILAVFDNSVAQFGEWPFGSGETVGSTAVVGQFAYIGDADLNGQVTPDDYGAIDSNLGQHVGTAEESGGMNWFAGDWNFDGDITPDDYGAVDANLGNGQTQGPQLASNGLAANGLAAVPEPGSIAILGVGAAGMLFRRRRQH
ncbi:MAG TPA: PEP-CTERM sorting domain-containing protein [Tepidisphaeraceae bacterium]|jgi:hypothetical protein